MLTQSSTPELHLASCKFDRAFAVYCADMWAGSDWELRKALVCSIFQFLWLGYSHNY